MTMREVEEESSSSSLSQRPHPLEDTSSWVLHVSRRRRQEGEEEEEAARDVRASSSEEEEEVPPSLRHRRHRNLKKHHKHHDTASIDKSNLPILTSEEEAHLAKLEHEQATTLKHQKKSERKQRLKHAQEVYANPGIQPNTVHGLIIDAGSTGSRMHVYEFDKRTLHSHEDVDSAVRGEKLSYPDSESRWTERLRPGLSTFGNITNTEELLMKVGEYLQPLLEFAKNVLHSKTNEFHTYPIYIKATAGMRELPFDQRQRIISAVRDLLSTEVYSPFAFEDEYARVISGEEEAIYGWAGVNFILGTLLEDSQGSGTVSNPKLTYGALDLGGGSTQISFFEPHQDIMSNLFKLQIGSAKHWNVYAHSYLYFGMNAAMERMGARLSFPSPSVLLDGEEKDDDEEEGGMMGNKQVGGVSSQEQQQPVAVAHSPCLPRGSVVRFTSSIHMTPEGIEAWPTTTTTADATTTTSSSSSSPPEKHDATTTTEDNINNGGRGEYTTILRNDGNTNSSTTTTMKMTTTTADGDDDDDDFEQCQSLTRSLLRQSTNSWCDFAHRHDCSFAGVYQPRLPHQSTSPHFGEFLAFSNYYHVWDFLDLNVRSNMTSLFERTQLICHMNVTELDKYNHDNHHIHHHSYVEEYDLPHMCFKSMYVYELLTSGYGFGPNDYVTATNVVGGQKVGWALGSMLYEINTLPWQYDVTSSDNDNGGISAGNDDDAVIVSPSGIQHHKSSTATTWATQFFWVVLMSLLVLGGLSLCCSRQRRFWRKKKQIVTDADPFNYSYTTRLGGSTDRSSLVGTNRGTSAVGGGTGSIRNQERILIQVPRSSSSLSSSPDDEGEEMVKKQEQQQQQRVMTSYGSTSSSSSASAVHTAMYFGDDDGGQEEKKSDGTTPPRR